MQMSYSSCRGFIRLFVFAHEGGDSRIAADPHRRYFLPRLEIKDYNIEIDARNFMIRRLIITKKMN